MNFPKLTKILIVAGLSMFLGFAALQLTTQPAKAAGTCTCPAFVFFPSCGFIGSGFLGPNEKCCYYSCGVAFCGVDGGPGPC